MDLMTSSENELLKDSNGASLSQSKALRKLKELGVIMFVISICTTGLGLFFYIYEVDCLSSQMVQNFSGTNARILAIQQLSNEAVETNDALINKVDNLYDQVQTIAQQRNNAAGVTKNNLSNQCRWVESKNGEKPSDAVKVGTDTNGEMLYVARMRSEGALVPAKLAPSWEKAFITLDGRETGARNYEVLCNCPVQWQSMSDGQIPDEAFIAGHMKGGRPLYVGRAKHIDALIPGKVRPSGKACYIPYGDKEYIKTDFEIMVLI